MTAVTDVAHLLSPAALARDEMATVIHWQPTIAEMVVALRALPDGADRTQLLEWYWALAAEKHGPVRARWYRDEYEWLRRNR